MKSLIYTVVLSMISPVVLTASESDSGNDLPPLFNETEILSPVILQDVALADSYIALLHAPYPQDLEPRQEEIAEPAQPTLLRTKRLRPGVNASSDSPEKTKPVCIMCGKIFSSESNLKRHIKTEHEEVRYQCPSCEESYKNKTSLQEHIKGEHKGETYPCSFCEENFIHKSSLQRHINNVHIGVRPICCFCKESFAQKGALKIHIRSVHEEKRYPCYICDQSFSQKCNVARHIRRVHSGSAGLQKRQRGNG